MRTEDADRADTGDYERLPAKVHWPLVACCFAIAALHLVPAAITYAQWRFSSGLLSLPDEPLPLECLGLSAAGAAFLLIAVGLIWRRHRGVVCGLLLFLVTAASFMTYELFFRAAS